jgi:hypothetical protein
MRTCPREPDIPRFRFNSEGLCPFAVYGAIG